MPPDIYHIDIPCVLCPTVQVMSADLKSQLLLRHRKKEAELESRAREKLELARLRFEEEQRRKQEELRQRKVKQLIIRV